MVEPKDTHFTERISIIGVLYIIYGALSFFGFNNYAPYSLLFIRSGIQFFEPKIVWFSFVMVTTTFLLMIILRTFKTSKETKDPGFSKFNLYYFLGGSLVIVATVLVFAFSFFPYEVLFDFRMTAIVGTLYTAILSIGYFIQIIAWKNLYLFGKKQETKVAKTIHKIFAKVPIFLIFVNIIGILSLVLSFSAGIFIIRDEFSSPFPLIFDTFDMPKIATFIQFAWIIINTVGYIALGLRIVNKPRSSSGKTFTTQKKDVKVVKQSCPVCRYTIYEGQTLCPNCGYRI